MGSLRLSFPDSSPDLSLTLHIRPNVSGMDCTGSDSMALVVTYPSELVVYDFACLKKARKFSKET